MKAMECTICGGELDIFVEVLNPMMSVPIDMLEKAVIHQCRSCHDRSPDFSQIECPECFEKKLTAEVIIEKNIGIYDTTGHIFCSNCELDLVF